MQDKLIIQKITPENSENLFPNFKILQNEKGKAVFLNSTEAVHTVAFLEFIPNTGIRGNHYHREKREMMYLIKGKLNFYYWLPDHPEIQKKPIEAGDFLIIEPGLAHAYEAIEYALGFEMGSSEYNANDSILDLRIHL